MLDDLKKYELNKEKIVELLKKSDFSDVYEAADYVRHKNVGDIVHLRAIIEFSNVCKRQCVYCGLNRENKQIPRYRMNDEEIIAAAGEAVSAGYRTIVIQSGEDDFFTVEKLGMIIREIKDMGAYVTVSCGEKSEAEYKYLRDCGADRYLLKHETSDVELYSKLHPCGTLENRIDCLKTLRKLGYETGSGFMIGLPGQSVDSIAEDILLLSKIPCQMAGIGPFISNPKTPLADSPDGDPELARRAVAVTRLLIPTANLPITTSLALLTSGDANPFAFGANVIMKKITPDKYKEAYEIYPGKYEKTDIKGDRKKLEEIIKRFNRIPL